MQEQWQGSGYHWLAESPKSRVFVGPLVLWPIAPPAAHSHRSPVKPLHHIAPSIYFSVSLIFQLPLKPSHQNTYSPLSLSFIWPFFYNYNHRNHVFLPTSLHCFCCQNSHWIFPGVCPPLNTAEKSRWKELELTLDRSLSSLSATELGGIAIKGMFASCAQSIGSSWQKHSCCWACSRN